MAKKYYMNNKKRVTGRRRFKCLDCGQRFGTYQQLFLHATKYHKDLIEDAHDELQKQQRKQKHHKSQMKAYISYLSNVYKCLPDMILDMRVNYFFDAIKRTNAINEAATLPFMMYYGMVDGSNKQNQKRLDPMRYDV